MEKEKKTTTKNNRSKLSSLGTKHNQSILDSKNNNQRSSLELNILNAIDDHGQRTSLEPIFIVTPSEVKSHRPPSTCTMGMILNSSIPFNFVSIYKCFSSYIRSQPIVHLSSLRFMWITFKSTNDFEIGKI